MTKARVVLAAVRASAGCSCMKRSPQVIHNFQFGCKSGHARSHTADMTITSNSAIRCRTRAELLAIPAAQFGFEPRESVVLLRMSRKEVLFMARLDLDHIEADVRDAAARITIMAMSHDAPDAHWLLLGYSTSPTRCTMFLQHLTDELGDVSLAFLTDGVSSWEVVQGVLIDEEMYEADNDIRTQVLNHTGGHVESSREAAVTAVRHWAPSKQLVANAKRITTNLHSDGRLQLLQQLLEKKALDAQQAATLAALLGFEECLAEAVTRMSQDVAAQRRAVLLTARVQSAARNLGNVLCLLALAYWLEGNGTLAWECLAQLGDDAQTHPLGRTVGTLLELGIPPSRWDEH